MKKSKLYSIHWKLKDGFFLEGDQCPYQGVSGFFVPDIFSMLLAGLLDKAYPEYEHWPMPVTLRWRRHFLN